MTMPRAVLILLLCGAAALAGCAGTSGPTSDETDCAQRFGLHQTRYASERVEMAILYANMMLDPQVRFRLTPTWPNSVLTPEYRFNAPSTADSPVTAEYQRDLRATGPTTHDVVLFHNAIAIPVFLIDDGALASTESFFVPDDQTCVIVNVRRFERLYAEFGLTKYIQANGGSVRHQTMAVSVALLHEVGHLHFRDRGSYTTPQALLHSDLTVPTRQVRNPELRADRFAIDEIVESGARQNAAFLPGYSLDLIAGDLLRTIKYAVSNHEMTEDPFGLFDHTVKPYVFSNTSYSHPNLYMRFYLMDLMLDPNTSRETELHELGVLE